MVHAVLRDLCGLPLGIAASGCRKRPLRRAFSRHEALLSRRAFEANSESLDMCARSAFSARRARSSRESTRSGSTSSSKRRRMTRRCRSDACLRSSRDQRAFAAMVPRRDRSAGVSTRLGLRVQGAHPDAGDPRAKNELSEMLPRRRAEYRDHPLLRASPRDGRAQLSIVKWERPCLHDATKSCGGSGSSISHGVTAD
jgi:hypothetical protein